MSHISKEHWSRYIKNELSDIERARYEEHLYTCEPCLNLYMECLAEQEKSLPHVEDETIFIEMVITALPHAKPKLSLIQNPIFQYAIATAITLLLMTTGVFQDIFTGVSQFSEVGLSKANTSISQQLVDKTVAVFDALQETKRGGK